MIEFEHYRSGGLYGIRYHFTQQGDALPTHEHERDTFHNIIVLTGAVQFRSERQRRDLRAGDVFDFDGTHMHTVVCIDPGSQILNVYLNGIPMGYEQLTPNERKGVLGQ